MQSLFLKQLKSILSKYPNANELLSCLMELGETLILGGALRAYRDNRLTKTPRDIDVVIDCDENELLHRALAPFSHNMNRFGGYKITFDNLSFDIWLLKDTWAFKEKKIVCDPRDYCSRLQDTVFLNTDAIVYSLTKDIWYQERYLQAMKSRVLDVVLQDNPQISLNILRAVLFKRKYSMSVSEKLKSIIAYHIGLTNDYLDVAMAIQSKHYKRQIISKIDLEHELNRIIMICSENPQDNSISISDI